jgi:hypothetical protein
MLLITKLYTILETPPPVIPLCRKQPRTYTIMFGVMRDGAGCELRPSCDTYCHIRIKLAATSTTDEPAFLGTLNGLSVCSRQFRVSNEPKMVSVTKRNHRQGLHGVGPWAVNYVDPADDPRKKTN